MKRKKIFLLILFIIGILLITTNVKADNNNKQVSYTEYTDEYKEWLKLSEEEKQMCVAPPMYAIPETTYNSANPLKLARMGVVDLETSYTLRKIIEENLVIKNQGSSPSCWAFAMLSSLETHLALKNYVNNNPIELYDFSEMHMEYATTRKFLNNEINEKGYNIDLFKLGTFRRAVTYLTNGFGAVDESNMPFEEYCNGCSGSADNKVELSTILDKKVITQVNDVIEFPTYDITDSNMENIEKLKVQLKNHIKTYGGVSAGIYHTNNSSEYFNYDYSAVYCDNKSKCPINHAVTIVGWDDNFETTKFGKTTVPEENRIQPPHPGAWIIKNSYGTGITYTYEEVRDIYCTVSRLKVECQENGWDKDSSLIPKEKVLELVEYNKLRPNNDGTYTRKVGEDGYFYISYEDVNIYKNLFGILNASTKITYDNIYQYNDHGWNYNAAFKSDTGKLYLANVFKKNSTSTKEYLTQVSLLVPETNTVSVYVNPNGAELNKDNLQLVELKAGMSETFGAGYHTLEFLNPIEITGEEFVVVVEIQKSESSNILVRLEGYDKGEFEIPGIASGKGFYSANMTDWENFSNYILNKSNAQTDNNYIGADNTIKAFTISEIERIEITTPPTHTTYIEGNNFNTLGMKVEAVFMSGARIEITDYNIDNGSSLKLGQKNVTISYLGKTQTQDIVVEKNIVESIKITKNPKTLEYIEGQNFNPEGLEVTAYYKNGTSVVIENYQINGGENLTPEKTNIEIVYEEAEVKVTTTLKLKVNEKTLQAITVEDNNVKKSYIEGQNFEPAGLTVIANYEYLNIELDEEAYEILNDKNLQIGLNKIIIRYQEKDILKEATIEVEVIAKETISISIEKSPNKINYIEGQNFDSTGMIINAIINNGEQKNVTEYITIVNGTNLQVGQKNVTIKYQEKEITQAITVVKKQIQSISIKALPIKKTYIQNKETLDLTGGTISVVYDNGFNETVDMLSDSVIVTGYDNTKIGNNNLTLTYLGKTLEFSVEIKEDITPKNSNFANASASFNSIKAYYYTINNKQNYVTMETVVSHILKNKENEKLEYYYFLSSNQEESNIENWVKIKETQNIESNKLTFTINTKDIINYDEVSTTDVLYLYIKEVATRENKQQTSVSNALLLENNIEIEEYVDNIKQEPGMGSINENISENPQTGNLIIYILLIIGSISLIYILYYNHKKRNA